MRRLFRSGGKRKGLAALLVLSVFFSPARPAQAESYDPGRLGASASVLQTWEQTEKTCFLSCTRSEL